MLRLACTPQVYAQVPNSEPFVQTNAPPPLEVQPGATQYQIQQQQDEHAERVQVFKEVIAIERILIQQIVVALDSNYIKTL